MSLSSISQPPLGLLRGLSSGSSQLLPGICRRADLAAAILSRLSSFAHSIFVTLFALLSTITLISSFPAVADGDAAAAVAALEADVIQLPELTNEEEGDFSADESHPVPDPFAGEGDSDNEGEEKEEGQKKGKKQKADAKVGSVFFRLSLRFFPFRCFFFSPLSSSPFGCRHLNGRSSIFRFRWF